MTNSLMLWLPSWCAGAPNIFLKLSALPHIVELATTPELEKLTLDIAGEGVEWGADVFIGGEHIALAKTQLKATDKQQTHNTGA